MPQPVVPQRRIEIDEEPAPGFLKQLALARRGAVADRRERPEGRDPERLHRLGHHLYVAERGVEVKPPVRGPRRRIERRDRAGLDDEELAVRQTPLDVLLPAVVLLDP